MTGYTIELGYTTSGSSFQGTREKAWAIVERYARGLCASPELIAAEALAYGAPAELGGDLLADYAEKYRLQDDGTISFEIGEDGTPIILQLASGGNPTRILKEHLRRAFCRLVLQEAHRHLIEINIRVS